MIKRLIRLTSAFLTIALVLTGAAVQAAKLKVETGPKAEVTHDGLYRVDHTKMARVWVKPDLDLSKYNKIILHDAAQDAFPGEALPTTTVPSHCIVCPQSISTRWHEG